MKKNVMMRAASALLVAVLLTTCAISGTFAKYTTSASAEDSARVAKFGVQITANGSMFSKNYEAAADGNGMATEVKGSVDSSNTDNIFAPGTKGEMASMTLTGTPEVKVEVTYAGTVDLGDNWLAKQDKDSAESYYCPLKVTVGTTEMYGLDYDSADAFEAAIKAAIDGTSKQYAALTDLSAQGADSLAISWEWAFEGENGTAVNRTDYADTYLGDAANKGNITIAVTTTVTQVD